jgi:hypothetical protein
LNTVHHSPPYPAYFSYKIFCIPGKYFQEFMKKKNPAVLAIFLSVSPAETRLLNNIFHIPKTFVIKKPIQGIFQILPFPVLLPK